MSVKIDKSKQSDSRFDELVREAVGDVDALAEVAEDPVIDTVEVDTDALKAFMGTCHCSLAGIR